MLGNAFGKKQTCRLTDWIYQKHQRIVKWLRLAGAIIFKHDNSKANAENKQNVK